MVTWFRYSDYMAYHYAFMMKVVVVKELETFAKATEDPRWIEAKNEEMQAQEQNTRPYITITS